MSRDLISRQDSTIVNVIILSFVAIIIIVISTTTNTINIYIVYISILLIIITITIILKGEILVSRRELTTRGEWLTLTISIHG